MAGLTIKDMLTHPKLEGIRLVTGHKKLDNEVHNVNIIDNPHSYEWFTAGDFLLTTGYIFKDDEASQRTLIKELADINCSGLGIKIKRYWEEIPTTIMEEATRLKFPVVEIPFTYSLAQVSNIINDEVFKRENSELNKYKDITRTFNQVTLDGGDLWDVMAKVKTMVDNPVVMLDSQFQLLAYVEHDDNNERLSDWMTLEERTPCFPKSFTEDIPQDIKRFPLSLKRDLTKGQKQVTCRIKPIAHAQTLYGYIVVWETVRKLERIDYVALETAAMSAALERIKTRQIEEAKNRQRQDFFNDVIEGKILSMNALKNLATLHGVNTQHPHVVLVIELEEETQPLLNAVLETMKRVAKTMKLRVHTFSRQAHGMGLYELSGDLSLSTKGMQQYIAQLQRALKAHSPSIDYRIGVSNVCHDFLTISRAAGIAFDVLKMAPMIHGNNQLYDFQQLISYHLLDSTIDNDHMLEFFEHTLGTLHTYDYAHNSDLIGTLEKYYECHGNISETAKQLYVHRNTIIYRLEKIKAVLSTDLLNAEENFNYQMALRIYKLLQLHHIKGKNAQ